MLAGATATIVACSGSGTAIAPIRGASPVQTQAPAPTPTSPPAESTATPIAATPSPTPIASAMPTKPPATPSPTPTPTPVPSPGSGSGSISAAPQLIYVAEANNPTVDVFDRSFNLVGSFTDVSTASDTFGLGTLQPISIARDPAGNVYVKGKDATVRKYAAFASGNVKPIDAFGQSYTPRAGLAVDGGNAIYSLGGSTPTIFVYPQTIDKATIQPPTQSATDTTDFSIPVALAVDSARNVYVGDPEIGQVSVFRTPLGGSSSATSALPFRRLNVSGQGPRAIAVDPDGNIFVESSITVAPAEISPEAIAVFAPTGTRPTRTYTLPSGYNVIGLAIDRNTFYALLSNGTSTMLAGYLRFTNSPDPYLTKMLAQLSQGIAI